MSKNKKEPYQPVYLVQGMESKGKINCLLNLTKIDSERKVKAIHYHFVDGHDISTAAIMFDVPQPNITDAIKTLNKVAEQCEKFHEIKMLSKFYNK